jgi:RNA polymerase sigma-70 factor (ECF subfamily)
VIKMSASSHDEGMTPAAISDSFPAALAVGEVRDDGRLRRIFDEHFDFVWRCLRRFGLSEDRADDAAQQVFIIVARKIEAIVIGSERSYLMGTAMRVAADVRRSAPYRREVPHADPQANASVELFADDLVDRKRARELLDLVLAEMDLDLRSVFVLFEIEEMTTSEIAETLAIPHGTVASRLRRAREEFQARVDRLRRQPRGGCRE